MTTLNCGSADLLAKAIRSKGSEAFNSAFLAWLQSAVPFDGLTAIAYFQNSRAQSVYLWSISDATHSLIDSVYLNGAYQIDPLYQLHEQQLPRGCYRVSDIAPDKFHRTQYFEDYYRFTGTMDEIGMLTYPSPGVSLVISLNTDQSINRRFSRKNRETITGIFPLVAALAENHWSDLEAGRPVDQLPLDSALINALREEHDISLSPRQAQVAILVLKGHSTCSIALRLGISPQTVKVFRKQIYKRCHISSQAEMFRLFLPLISI